MNFRMPAEWEPHQGTLLTWPHDEAHWPGLFEHIPPIWARMTKELEVGEEVHIVTHNEVLELEIKQELKKAKVQGDRVFFHRIPSNFAWARDHGPIVVKNEAGERLLLDWKFNAHGNDWAYDQDDAIPRLLGEDMNMRTKQVDMVLEGGSIDVNGLGTLLTTEDCLLNPNRNPELTKDDIEKILKDNLGVTNVLWLGKGIVGDDTSGHIDDLTRFVGPKTVVTIITDDPSDQDYAPLQENLARLQTMKDQDGNALEVITLTQPMPTFVQGVRIPASYANFYIANECVLLPVWNDSHDAEAIATLQRCFPSRRIVPIDSTKLTWGLGSFHCVTQQIPA